MYKSFILFQSVLDPHTSSFHPRVPNPSPRRNCNTTPTHPTHSTHTTPRNLHTPNPTLHGPQALHGMLGDVDFRMLWESRNRPFTVTKMLGAIVSDAYTDPAKIEKRSVIYEI